ncbi:MAG: hypothetical protein ACUVQ8_05310 [Nitrososphaeria archaeon]
MRDLSSIIEEILRKRPDIHKEQVLALIHEKKNKIGSGYLTDTGAAYLVAADLGLILDFEPPSGLEIRNMYIGANSVNLSCRVCSVSETRNYVKKDGTTGTLVSMIIFDKTGFIKCNLWDSKADEMQALNLTTNDAIQIKRAYVRPDFNNFPSLHVGQRGLVQRIEDKEMLESLPTLEEIAIPLDDPIPQANLFCIKGMIHSQPTLSSFSRKDGSQGTVLSFIVRGLKKDVRNRVVIWLPLNASKDIPEVDSPVVIGPVRSKPQATGEIEFHGDEKTVILQLEDTTLCPSPKILEAPLHLLSIGLPQKTRKGTTSVNALVMKEDKTILTLIGLGEIVPFLLSMKNGEVIEGSFTLLDKGKLLCSDPNKIAKKARTVPLDLSNLYQKISSIKSDADKKDFFFLKAVAISQPTHKEVTVKNGEKVTFSELMIGDETDEINLIAWRNLAQIIDNIMPGERLIISGVTLRTKPIPALEIKPFTSIVKISE